MHASSAFLLASMVLILAGTGDLRGQTVDVDQRLGALKQGFDGALDRDALQPRKDAMDNFNKGYLATLDRALTAATQAGKLDEAVVLRAEKERVTSGRPVPVGEDRKTVEALKPVRDSVSGALARIDDDYLKRLRPLLERYDQALAALQTEATKAGKIDDGLRVKAMRDRVAKARVSGDLSTLQDGAAASGSAGGTATAVVPAMPKASVKSVKDLEGFLPGTVWTWVVPDSKGEPDKLRFDQAGNAQIANFKARPWTAKDSRTVDWGGSVIKFNKDFTEFEASTSSGPRSGKRVAN